MTRFAAVVSLGTQTDSFEYGLRDLVRRQFLPLDLFVLYGSVGDPDKPDPQEILDHCKELDMSPDVRWKESQQCQNSWALEPTYRDAMELLKRLESAHKVEPYEKVFACLTGGTKPMIVATTLVVQSRFPNLFWPLYVQGHEKHAASEIESVEIFEGPGIRDDQTILRALDLACHDQFAAAATLTKMLPKSSCRSFLSNGLLALAAWDDFDYKTAHSRSKEAYKIYDNLSEDQRLKPLAKIVSRIQSQAGPMTALSRELADSKLFVEASSKSDWPKRIRTTGHDLVIDALANADRKLQKGRYTDAVLRGYRACECSVHMKLLVQGIHPSWPGVVPDKAKALNIKMDTGGSVRSFDFNSALNVLRLRDSIDGTHPELVRNLQTPRNWSYLEHGYQRIGEEQAKKHFENAKLFCCHVLAIKSAELTDKLACFALLES